MLFVCYTPKFPENPEPNRTNRDLGRSCSVSSRSIGCSSRFGLGLGREVKNLIGIGLNPRTDTEHRAVSVHSQAWWEQCYAGFGEDAETAEWIHMNMKPCQCGHRIRKDGDDCDRMVCPGCGS